MGDRITDLETSVPSEPAPDKGHANSVAWLSQIAPAGRVRKKGHRRLKRSLRFSLTLAVPEAECGFARAILALTHSVLAGVQFLHSSASEARDPCSAAGMAWVFVALPRRWGPVKLAFIPWKGTYHQSLESRIQELLFAPSRCPAASSVFLCRALAD